jgi:hypothetical protein
MTLQAGTSLSLPLRFTPAAQGRQYGTLTLRSNDPSVPAATVQLTGNGTGAGGGSPQAVLWPEGLELGQVLVGEAVTGVFYLMNVGSAPLRVESITSDDPQLAVVAPTPPFTVDPFTDQEVEVRFQAAAEGESTGFLTIVTNDPVSPTSNYPVVAGGLVPVETDMVSGVPFAFQVPAVPQATLFTGNFSIIVPPGATKLEVTLASQTAGVDVDLFVQYGVDVSLSGDGGVLADHVSATLGGNERIVITPETDFPLMAGRYYIAFGQFTTGVAADLVLTATVGEWGGPGSHGAVRITGNGRTDRRWHAMAVLKK